jgi:hypothetical protein
MLRTARKSLGYMSVVVVILQSNLVYMHLLQHNSSISNLMRIQSAVSKVPTCRSSEGQAKKVKAQAHFVLYRFESTGKENKK